MQGEISLRFMQTLQQIEETKDVESLVALFADKAELTNLAMSEPLTGKEGARQFWQKYLSVFEQIHSDFTNVIEGDNTVVLEWVSKGTLSTSEPVQYRGVSILEISNDQVDRFRTYYDSAVFLPQGAKEHSKA